MIPTFILSSLLIFSTQQAFAKDKALLDALHAEADETSMVKEVALEDATPEPSVDPKAITDYDALEKKVAQQITGLLEGASTGADAQFENQLESIVSSALLEGTKLDDIRSAVTAAMHDIKKNSVPKGNISTDIVESASKALDNIVGETAVVVEKVAKSKVVQTSVDNSVIIANTVTVLDGENLYKIAQRVYGSGRKYLELYEANKDILKNPNLIRAGQVLKVP
jgi:nucleoid-associated protein YgaU